MSKFETLMTIYFTIQLFLDLAIIGTLNRLTESEGKK